MSACEELTPSAPKRRARLALWGLAPLCAVWLAACGSSEPSPASPDDDGVTDPEDRDPDAVAPPPDTTPPTTTDAGADSDAPTPEPPPDDAGADAGPTSACLLEGTCLGGIKSLSAGALHTCAANAGGKVYCWGANFSGELGLGTAGVSAGRTEPTEVPALAGIVAVAVGDTFSCALDDAGLVRCWGDNSSGALGSGDLDDRRAPGATIDGLTDVTQLVAGAFHACALRADRSVWCWGQNQNGQAADTMTARVTAPVQVELADVVQISAGNTHTCAVTSAGVAYCWGGNMFGQLGTDSIASSSSPEAVAGGLTVRQIEAGGFHTCAVDDGGAVWCWGQGSGGQLGVGEVGGTGEEYAPVQLPSLTEVRVVMTGGFHSCAILANDEVSCWGSNQQGQLGVGDTDERDAPQALAALGPVRALTSTMMHTCALLHDGSARCWGSNDFGQLGVATGGGGIESTPRIVTAP